MEIRYSADINTYKKMSTEELRKSFLVESLFEKNKICLLYSDTDRAIIGSAVPAILRNPITDHSDEYWDKVIEVNLSSQFVLTREIGKDMAARGTGKIIFIASLLSFQGGILVPGYSASKGGVKQLTMAFANEWAPKGVNVNAIAPGYIATDNTKALREDPVRNKTILDRIPAGKWGNPEYLMGTVVFLASDASNYLNGSVIVVDGGWMGR